MTPILSSGKCALHAGFVLIALMLPLGTARAQVGLLDMPLRAAVDAQNNVFVTEVVARRIAKFDSSGTLVTRFGGPGTAPGQFLSVQDLAIDPAGNILVLDRTAKTVVRFSNAGLFIDTWQLFPTASTVRPHSLVVDSSGRLFVSDDADGSIFAFTSTGQFVVGMPVITGQSGNDTPGDLTLDATGNLYAADRMNQRILRFGTSGPPTNPLTWRGWIGGCTAGPLCQAVSGMAGLPSRTTSWCMDASQCGDPVRGTGKGRFDNPIFVSAAADGSLYVSDVGSGVIQRFDTSGAYIGDLAMPGRAPGQTGGSDSTAVGPNGDVYAVQMLLGRVSRFTPGGTFVSVFGGGVELGVSPGDTSANPIHYTVPVTKASTISVSSIGGYTGPLSLAATRCIGPQGVPAQPCSALGITTSFSNSNVTVTTGGAGTTLLVTVTPSTPDGSTLVIVDSTTSGVPAFAQVLLDVRLQPPALNLATLNVKGPVTLQGSVSWQCNATIVGPPQGLPPIPCPAQSSSIPRWLNGDGFTVTDANSIPTLPRIYVPGSTVNFQANASFTDDTGAVQLSYTDTSVETVCSKDSDCASGSVCQQPAYCRFPPYCGPKYCTARTCRSSMFPGAIEGNDAHYSVVVQRWDKTATSCTPPRPSLDPDYPDVRFDVPSPTGTSATTGGTGCWVDLANGTTELFGSSTGPPSSTTAAQDATVSTQLGVVANLPDVVNYVRYLVTVSEGDTRVSASRSVTGWGPGKDSPSNCAETATLNPDLCAVRQLTDALVETEFSVCPQPASLRTFYNWTIQHPTSPSSFTYTTALNPLQVVVQPVALVQLKVLPYTLLYMPPGNASKATFATTTSFGISMAADSKLAGNVSTTVDNKYMETIGAVNNLLGAILGAATGVQGITIADSYSNATSWDKNTKTGVGSISDVATSQSTTYQLISSFTLSNPGLTPGANGTYANAPFWSDTFLLLKHPQVGFWQLGGVPVISLLAAAGTPAAPDFFTPTVADLDHCYRQVAPFAAGMPIPGTSDVLTKEDCQQLLQLDPFYGVGQNAPALASNPRAIPAGGTDYGVDPSSGSELNQSISSMLSYSGTTTATKVGSYTASVSDVLIAQGTLGMNLGAFGISGSYAFQGTETTTTSTDWTVTLQSSFAATAQSSTTITGSFDDRHGIAGSPLPYRPHVEVYRDSLFGSFMFQDPDAPGLNWWQLLWPWHILRH